MLQDLIIILIGTAVIFVFGFITTKKTYEK